MSNRIFLSPPHMGTMELNYISDAFDRNYIAPFGEKILSLEQSISEYLKIENGVLALNSGTSAIHLALILLGVTQGDEIICQSMTFVACSNPILYQGAKPIFVDSEKDTWNICPEALEQAIIDRINKGKKPKAIIAVHLYGMPYKHEEILEIAKKYEIPIIEDAAESLGSSYENKKCGTLGDLSILSFNGNKIITTSSGGALVTKNMSVKQRALYLATQAKDSCDYYQHSQLGYNYRMSNICAAIGLGQMEVLQNRIAALRENYQYYNSIFNQIKGVDLHQEYSNVVKSNHWLNCVLIEPTKTDGITNQDLKLALEKNNIESRFLWKPMHLQPLYSKEPFYGTGVSEHLFNQGLCLPSGSNMTSEDKNRIKKVIFELFN